VISCLIRKCYYGIPYLTLICEIKLWSMASVTVLYL